MAKRRCPVCNSDRRTNIYEVKLDNIKKYGLKNEYNVVVCKECGMCYSDTESTSKDYENYYINSNNYTSNSKVIDDGSGFFIEKIINKYFNKESKIINFGIGQGWFEKKYYSKGYTNIIGIDPSKESVSELRKMGINARIGSVYDTIDKDDEKKFDGVMLKYTLEHLFDVNKAIGNISDYLKNDGIFIVIIPDYGCMQNNTTEIPNNFNQEHINYFSRISLNNLMKNNNFNEIYTRSIILYHEDKQESVICSVYKLSNNINKNINKDYVTEQAIRAYLKNSDCKKNIINSKIEQLINEKEEIIIWGCGAYTANLLATTDLSKCNIKYFVDNNKLKIGQQIDNIDIKKPEAKLLDGKTILICSMLYSQEIIEQIESMNINANIYTL